MVISEADGGATGACGWTQVTSALATSILGGLLWKQSHLTVEANQNKRRAAAVYFDSSS